MVTKIKIKHPVAVIVDTKEIMPGGVHVYELRRFGNAEVLNRRNIPGDCCSIRRTLAGVRYRRNAESNSQSGIHTMMEIDTFAETSLPCIECKNDTRDRLNFGHLRVIICQFCLTKLSELITEVTQ